MIANLSAECRFKYLGVLDVDIWEDYHETLGNGLLS